MAIFDHVHQKMIETTFSFPEFAPEWKKKDFIPSVHFWFLWSDWPHPFLTKPTQKSFDQFLSFVTMYQHEKNQFIPCVHSSDTVNFRVPPPDLPHPFLSMLTPKISNHLLICVKLYQHAKYQQTPSIHSSDRVNFRIQRQNWPHPFWPCPSKNFLTNF